MTTNLDITAHLLDANTTFQVLHEDLFQGGSDLPGLYQMFTQTERNVGKLESNFFGPAPKIRRWLHPFPKGFLRAYGYDATPVSYKAELPIPRLDFVRDKTGLINRKIDGWLREEQSAFHEAVVDSIDSNSGLGETGYDGVAMFNASHPHLNSGSGASNLGAGTDLSHAAYIAARAVGRSIKDENGRPMRIVYDTMRVGYLLESRAREITGANRVVRHFDSGGNEETSGTAGSVQSSVEVENVHKGEVVLMVDDYVSTYFWDLFDLSKQSKPMLLVVERDLEPYPAPTDMGSPERRDEDLFVFGHDGEWIAVPAASILAYRGTGTA